MTHRWTNLGDLVDRTLDLQAPAIVDLRNAQQPVTWTHAEVDRLANGVAVALLALGLRAGTHVAIASLNRAEYVIAYFGIMRAGLVAVPINIKQSEENLDYVLRDADVALAFVDADRHALLAARVPVIDFDDTGPAGFAAQIRPADFAAVAAPADQVAQMLYTSGSTGKPKGVPLTHAGQLWALAATYAKPADPSAERYLLAQPLFHMNGLFMAKRAFSVNGLLVIQPGFEVGAYVDALERYRITVLAAVPTMFARIVKDAAYHEGRDFSALTRIMLGSAPMSLALFERIQAAFPHARIVHGYGTTEAGPSVFGPHPHGLPTPPLALGYPLFEDHVRLVNGATDREGVLLMRNPAVMHGYHRLPEKSAQVLNDGWYDSGDVMRRDENGFFYFVGRADDMFVCAGENIYPVEVEKLLESHPDVRQASVVPLPDEERAAVPVAFVVRQPGSTLSVHALKQHALAQGPAYQHPRRVAFVADLPWAGTNKVDRHALLQRARELEAANGWSHDAQGVPA
ncbi:class I adenylate-forming enzyme family protein [Paraburkholderia acidisoli]|uniref:AMP-binding protein n=1 Tax=Paraburkholderia acidisoli TaxID=2571748 RepID=A0A7Z2GPA5_9BURK|nr:class I adenylate-forming enzyme family protein [Paraburkholderia acidisoli]QGZ65462.1 AMP-binding protein [Paraburkholderia acidisoli]